MDDNRATSGERKCSPSLSKKAMSMCVMPQALQWKYTSWIHCSAAASSAAGVTWELPAPCVTTTIALADNHDNSDEGFSFAFRKYATCTYGVVGH